MGVHFMPDGRDTLHRLWAGASSEVALACDAAGLVTVASATIRRLGRRDDREVLGRPLWSLTRHDHADRVRNMFARTLRSGRRSDWIEVVLPGPNEAPRWFDLRIDPVALGPEHLPGALCVLRSCAERRRLERAAFAAAMTDPLTGFTNRMAFLTMLDHLAEQSAEGCLLLIDLDHFQAINFRHGHAAGDRLLVSFAALLRRLTCSQHILSRIDGETFAVTMPGSALADGLAIGEEVRSALAGIGTAAARDELPFTASIGLVALGPDSDETLRFAELAVTEAQARGRARIATCPPSRLRLPWRWNR